MSLNQDWTLDVTLPVIKEDTSQTSRLISEELMSVELATKQFLEGRQAKSNFQIAFLLPTRLDPITIRNTATITFGRADRERNAIPTIDLSDYNAHSLGVSRLHAKVLYMDGCFYIKDMGSINGTWINGQRLEAYQLVPIDRGDKIRLGKLAMTIV